jgi:hypothetical protein
MSTLPPGYSLPTYSEEAREETLFHYTTANGLLGILRNNEIWSTAYYCTNDESELTAGKDILTQVFRSKTKEIIQEVDSRVDKSRNHSGDVIWKIANNFDQMILKLALNSCGVYITCFCKPSNQEDFLHGLLSQWRGYGIDEGYALQISRSKLQARIEQAQEVDGLNYELQKVYYSPDNPLKGKVLKHAEAFTDAYSDFVYESAKLDFKKGIPNPIEKLLGGPLERLLDFLICTKNGHFSEENECRMSVIESASSGSGVLPANYFNRNGLLVPYVSTPASFKFLDCVEWIIVGPSPRIGDRFNSVTQMVRKMGLQIKVRPSQIPFSRA